jgi:hypothetical protein
MNLLVLNNRDQYKYIQNSKKSLFDDGLIITGDLGVASQAENDGKTFVSFISFLKSDEIAENMFQANKLTEKWCDEELYINTLDISMRDMSREELRSPFEICINTHIVLSRVFNEYDIKIIYVFFSEQIGMIRNGPAPAFIPAESISNAVLLWMSREIDLQIINLQSKQATTKAPKLWKPKISIKETIINITEKIDRINIQSLVKKHPNIALIWKNGLWPEEILNIDSEFTNTNNWRTIKVTSKEISLIKSNNHVNQLQSIFSYLDEMKSKMFFNQKIYMGDYPYIFSNSFLQFQFELIFAEIKKAVIFGFYFSDFLDLIQPKLVIFGFHHFTIERTLVNIAKKKEICTLGIFHGGVIPYLSYVYNQNETDRVLISGDVDEEGLKFHGIDNKKVLKIGNLRMLYKYSNNIHSYEEEKFLTNRNRARKILKLDLEKQVFLILTAPTSIGLTNIYLDQELHRKTWLDILSLAKDMSECIFAIKPHPAFDFIDFYKYLIKYGPRNIVLIEHPDLDIALNASNVAILLNVKTTAMLEAIICNIPVIFYKEEVIQSKWNEYPLDRLSDIKINSIEKLRVTLEKLMYDGAFKQEQTIKAKEYLKLFLGNDLVLNHHELIVKLEKHLLSKSNLYYKKLENTNNLKLGKYIEQYSKNIIPINELKDKINLEMSLNLTRNEQNNEHLEKKLIYLALKLALDIWDLRIIKEIYKSLGNNCYKSNRVFKFTLQQMFLRSILFKLLICYEEKEWKRLKKIVIFSIRNFHFNILKNKMFLELFTKSILLNNVIICKIFNYCHKQIVKFQILTK